MQISNVKLTIIIQGYNPKEESIKKTIESLNLQNDKNFKVLFFDNGSKVSWINLCEKYINKSINWEYKSFKGVNKGIGFGRNKATKFVNTDYLARVDDGDTISENFVKLINNKIRQNYDFILYRFSRQFKKSYPASYCLNKKIFSKYPEGKKFYIEDINSVLYYLLTAKNPVIINKKIYSSEPNSRWFNEQNFYNHIKNNFSTVFWLNKVTKLNNFSTKIKIDHFNFRKKSMTYIKKFNDLSKIVELRIGYDKLPRKYLKTLKQIYKKIRVKNLNPIYKLWPSILYRFFIRKPK